LEIIHKLLNNLGADCILKYVKQGRTPPTLVLRPAGSSITFWLAISCCQQNPLEASNVLAYLLWQLNFQAIGNSLILQ
jgi:hypothetical protein